MWNVELEAARALASAIGDARWRGHRGPPAPHPVPSNKWLPASSLGGPTLILSIIDQHFCCWLDWNVEGIGECGVAALNRRIPSVFSPMNMVCVLISVVITPETGFWSVASRGVAWNPAASTALPLAFQHKQKRAAINPVKCVGNYCAYRVLNCQLFQIYG